MRREDTELCEQVKCGLCGTMTSMLGTKRCDSCWELEGRIQRNPQLASKILGSLGYVSRQDVIEECAKVAENTPTTLCQNGDFFSERVAKAIRALSSQSISPSESK